MSKFKVRHIEIGGTTAKGDVLGETAKEYIIDLPGVGTVDDAMRTEKVKKIIQVAKQHTFGVQLTRLD